MPSRNKRPRNKRKPDLIVFDESHLLKPGSLESARRVAEYFQNHPATRVTVVSSPKHKPCFRGA